MKVLRHAFDVILGGVGLGRSVFGWVGNDKLAWVGSGGVGSGWAGLGWVGLGWAELGWAELGWAGLSWAGLKRRLGEPETASGRARNPQNPTGLKLAQVKKVVIGQGIYQSFSIYLSIYLSIHLSTYLSIYLPTYLSIYL